AAYHTHFPSYLAYYHLKWCEPLVWKYLRWFYRQCQVVFVPTLKMQQTLTAKKVLPQHASGMAPLTLWGRGVDHTAFHANRRSVDLRNRWGGDELQYLAFAGRLVW